MTPVSYYSQGGAIDPAGFTDTDGTLYIVYKIDGNALGGGGACGNGNLAYATPIMLQRLAPDGITPVGTPIKLLDRGPYDGPVIEAPSLIYHQGTYILFFSSNCYNGPYYDVSYAMASAVGGPYTKSSKPLLLPGGDGGKLDSPGGADASQDGKKLVFHADQTYESVTVSEMGTAEITVKGSEVSVDIGVGTSVS